MNLLDILNSYFAIFRQWKSMYTSFKNNFSVEFQPSNFRRKKTTVSLSGKEGRSMLLLEI